MTDNVPINKVPATANANMKVDIWKGFSDLHMYSSFVKLIVRSDIFILASAFYYSICFNWNRNNCFQIKQHIFFTHRYRRQLWNKNFIELRFAALNGPLDIFV